MSNNLFTPEQILAAYAQGYFPMADSEQDAEAGWLYPKMRGQLSIDHLHIPRSLKKVIRQSNYNITINQDFDSVIRACADTTNMAQRQETWINPQIRDSFIELNIQGYAHSVEFRQDGVLQGGLYGLSIGGAFCGESMFSRTPNASKIALVHLCARLQMAGYTLLDTQFTNAHLEQFGVFEISHEEYLARLTPTLGQRLNFELCGVSEASILKSYGVFF